MCFQAFDNHFWSLLLEMALQLEHYGKGEMGTCLSILSSLGSKIALKGSALASVLLRIRNKWLSRRGSKQTSHMDRAHLKKKNNWGKIPYKTKNDFYSLCKKDTVVADF